MSGLTSLLRKYSSSPPLVRCVVLLSILSGRKDTNEKMIRFCEYFERNFGAEIYFDEHLLLHQSSVFVSRCLKYVLLHFHLRGHLYHPSLVHH